MNKIEMLERLAGMGLKKVYKPDYEHETGAIILRTHKPAQIVDGLLRGTEIALLPKYRDTFLVWTCHATKARRIAKEHSLKVRMMTGEAELQVPASLADSILPQFGAKVRRNLTPEQLQAARARGKILAMARISGNS